MKPNPRNPLISARLQNIARWSACICSCIGTSRAADLFWDGRSVTNGNWSTVANWNGDTAVPGVTDGGTTNTDVATFNAALAHSWGLAATPVVTTANLNIGGLSFDSAAGNYFIGGSAIKLSRGGTIQMLSTLTATNAIETINAPLVIQGAAGTYTIANHSANGTGAGAGTLNIGGAISGAVAGATVLTLGGSNTNTNTVSGAITNGSATSLAVTKSGAGTWVLSGTNTFTGPGTCATTRTFAMAAGGSGTFQIDDNLNIGAVINGSGGLMETGAGRLSLSDANTYSGTTLISNGELRLADSSALQNSVLDTTGMGTAAGTGKLTFITGITSYTLGGLTGDNNITLTNEGATAVALAVGNSSQPPFPRPPVRPPALSTAFTPKANS